MVWVLGFFLSKGQFFGGKPVARFAILLVAGLLSLGCQVAFAAEAIGSVTILEGEATLIRSLAKWGVAEGVRVKPDDLIETGKTTFVRIELSDGVILDLGPASQVQLNASTFRRAHRPGLYLLSGWAKLTAAKAAGKASLASPLFDIPGLSGVAVMRSIAESSAVFAENGPVSVAAHVGATAMFVLKTGDYLALRKGAPARVDGRPMPDFVSALPSQFRDTIPSRLPQREVAPKPEGPFTCSEVQAWLDAEAAVRSRFSHDWAAKADEPAFRECLIAGLSRHPEWEQVLYPKPPETEETSAQGGEAKAQAAPAAGASVPAAERLAPSKDKPSSTAGH